jgi:hypothetical protein
MTLQEAIATIEKWQANLTITYILDQWYASANDIHAWQPTLAELLIDLASKLEAQP